MSVRNPEINMMKNLVAFQTHIKLVANAVKSTKTGLKKLQGMNDKLEALYFSLVESHHFYKADIISKEEPLMALKMMEQSLTLTMILGLMLK